MSEEKSKNNKRYETEWSFSFEQIGESINKAIGSLGEEPKKENFAAALEGATSARIVVGGSVGRTSIVALESSSENLFEAELSHLGEMEFTVTGDTEKVITLQPKRSQDIGGPIRRALGQIGKNQDLYTRVRISANIPVYLELNSGIGPCEFDLAELQLTGLKVDGGVGPTRLDLPSTERVYNVEVDGGVGPVTINAPSSTHVQLELEGGVGPSTLNIPADASLDIKMQGGVGGTTVKVEPGVALHIEAEGGLGGIHVPSTLKKLKETGDFISKGGTWESAGFALADKRVNIRYSGGLGGFNLKQAEVEIV